MPRLTVAGLVGSALCAVIGASLWIFGLFDGAGESNAHTELGSSLMSAALIALTVIGVERGLDSRQRTLDDERKEQEIGRERKFREELFERDRDHRDETRRQEARLLVTLASSLRSADLSGAELDGVALAGKDLSEAVLNRALLNSASLARAKLTGVVADSAQLRSANLAFADLGRSRFERSIFAGADLRHATLAGARISYSDLSDADLSDANCKGADFFQSDLSGANLCGADLTNAAGLWTGAMVGARSDSNTKWPHRFNPGEAKGLQVYKNPPREIDTLSGQSWDGMHFRRENVRSTSVTDASFRNAWVESLDFYQYEFKGCDFRGADLSGTTGLIGATFSDCVYDASTIWPERHFDAVHAPGLRLAAP